MTTAQISMIGAFLLGFATDALAEDHLPSELLLRCDLKQTALLTSQGKPHIHEASLVKEFRLKNGIFGETRDPIPVGKDCKLMDGEIVCAWSGVVPQKGESPGVQKRRSFVRLSRATGEISLTLETWSYLGDSVKGTPEISMTLNQSGLCRTIGSPLF